MERKGALGTNGLNFKLHYLMLTKNNIFKKPFAKCEGEAETKFLTVHKLKLVS